MLQVVTFGITGDTSQLRLTSFFNEHFFMDKIVFSVQCSIIYDIMFIFNINLIILTDFSA